MTDPTTQNTPADAIVAPPPGGVCRWHRGWKVKERVGFLTGKSLQDPTAAGAGAGATGAAIGVMR